jgi:hypothetical protein
VSLRPTVPSWPPHGVAGHDHWPSIVGTLVPGGEWGLIIGRLVSRMIMEPLLVAGDRCRQGREKMIDADPGDPAGLGKGRTQFGAQLRGPRQPYLGFTRDAWAASATPAITPSVLASSIAVTAPANTFARPPARRADLRAGGRTRFSTGTRWACRRLSFLARWTPKRFE